MNYTTNKEVKLLQIQYISAILKKLNIVLSELESFHCPSSGKIQEFEYILSILETIKNLK